MDTISYYIMGKFLQELSNAKTGLCIQVYKVKDVDYFIQKYSKMTEIQQLTYLSDYFIVHFVHFSVSSKHLCIRSKLLYYLQFLTFAFSHTHRVLVAVFNEYCIQQGTPLGLKEVP